MPDPKTIPATVTACTLDPQGRTALFHLSATSPSGEALSLLFPLRFPTLEELEAERGGVEILSDTEDQGEEEEQRADACPGCGCLPGDGLTEGCSHPEGCGYARAMGKALDEDEITSSAVKAGHDACAGGHYPTVDDALREYLLPASTPEELERLDAMAFRRGWAMATASGKAVENRPARRSLPEALRVLAEYLEPMEIPKELRDQLFMPEPVAHDYGPAGRERVVTRLESDVECYGTGTEGDGVASTLSLVLREIMGGRSPSDTLADYGILDG